MLSDHSVLIAKPSLSEQSWVRELFVILGASFIISLFAHISIPLPFTPVPLATQSAVILFLAGFLGARRAVLSVLTFLTGGAVGFPVFAEGKAGIAVLMGPTAGYFVGYVAAAFLVGFMVEKGLGRSLREVFLPLALGTVLILAFGWLGLSFFIGLKMAFLLGVCPFIIGDFLKIFLVLKGFKIFSSLCMR